MTPDCLAWAVLATCLVVLAGLAIGLTAQHLDDLSRWDDGGLPRRRDR